MIHSQLKINYPDCPFVWTTDDIKNTFNATSKKIPRNIFFKEISDKPKTEHIVQYLEKITQKLDMGNSLGNIFDNINYTFISQIIPIAKKDMWINFHTSVYNNVHKNIIINKELESDISWYVLPIIGNIIPANNIQYVLNDELPSYVDANELTTKIIKKSLEPNTYYGSIDNQFDKLEADVKCRRVTRRNFVKRHDEEKIEKEKKCDVICNNSMNENRPDVLLRRHIELNNNTLASGHLIRNRLIENPYKAYRFRTNPDLFKEQTKVNGYIKSNNTVIKKETIDNIIKNDLFDYVHDKVVIHKVSGILRFSPASSGKIKILADEDKLLYFVTVLRHQHNLHLTIHHITII